MNSIIVIDASAEEITALMRSTQEQQTLPVIKFTEETDRLAEILMGKDNTGRPSQIRIDRVALVAAMAQAGLEGKQLAQKTGLTRQTISRIKHGIACRTKTAVRLIAVLGEEIIANDGERR